MTESAKEKLTSFGKGFSQVSLFFLAVYVAMFLVSLLFTDLRGTIVITDENGERFSAERIGDFLVANFHNTNERISSVFFDVPESYSQTAAEGDAASGETSIATEGAADAAEAVRDAAAIERDDRGYLFSSENYQVQQISIGGDVFVLEDKNEYQKLEIKDVINETFMTKKQDELKLFISWKTNKMAICEVEYSRQNAENRKSIKEGNYGSSHNVILSRLEPSTAYAYLIKCKDRQNHEIASDRYVAFSGSKEMSVFELISETLNDVFGWALKKK